MIGEMVITSVNCTRIQHATQRLLCSSRILNIPRARIAGWLRFKRLPQIARTCRIRSNGAPMPQMPQETLPRIGRQSRSSILLRENHVKSSQSENQVTCWDHDSRLTRVRKLTMPLGLGLRRWRENGFNAQIWTTDFKYGTEHA